jgi:Domain of unknown function (DUF1707)/Domain of unknown function (DUF4190)
VPFEPSKHDLRASDADREATIERLRVAGMEGRLDSEELEQRIETAYASRWCSELEALTLDVTPPPARIDRAKPVFVRPKQRVNALAVASVVVSLFWIVGSIAAVIMGHVALRQISQSGGAQIGRAAALTGLAFGYFGLTVLLAAILFSAA